MNTVDTREEQLARYLLEECAACGLDFGAHCADVTGEWCPGHKGRMDWMRTTRFRETGRFFSESEAPAHGTPAKNLPCECDLYQLNGACHVGTGE